MNRKGFFKTLFGGFVAASAAPSLVKAKENIQPSKGFSLNNGNLGIGGSSNVGLGTNTPRTIPHVGSIIFHINDRRLEMSGNENGDFVIKWLDVEDHESSPRIMIEKPRPNPFRKSITNDIR